MPPSPQTWEECVGSSHAPMAMRADWRQHLTRSRRELGFKRVRFFGLLDDTFSVQLSEPEKIQFYNIDSVIDFLASIGEIYSPKSVMVNVCMLCMGVCTCS